MASFLIFVGMSLHGRHVPWYQPARTVKLRMVDWDCGIVIEAAHTGRRNALPPPAPLPQRPPNKDIEHELVSSGWFSEVWVLSYRGSIIRIIVYWGLPMYRNYHLGLLLEGGRVGGRRGLKTDSYVWR